MSKRLHIAVFFDDPKFDDYPFTEEEYRIAYRELAELIREKGADFTIVRDQKTFLEKNRFKGGWKFNGKEFARTEEELTVDLIYNKGHFQIEDSSNVLNGLELQQLCSDKWLSYQTFSQFFTKTRLAETKEGLIDALKQVQTNVAVIKPRRGEEGRGVMIKPPSEIDVNEARLPCLVQEYIDVSEGIPDLVVGPHDLRIICVRGEIGVSYIRTPPPKSLIANVARGGREIEVPTEKIPKGALKVFRTIDEAFSKYKTRIYSVDLGRDKSGEYKIIELNSKPGLSAKRTGKSYERFHELLANALIAAARDGV